MTNGGVPQPFFHKKNMLKENFINYLLLLILYNK